MEDQLSAKAHALLRRFYGYSSFRPMQLDIIRSVCSGNDTVVIMPTGGGKSICYQLPALLQDGCAVVISPLIALMVDQVSALKANGIPAAAVNSFNSDHDNRAIMEMMYAGRLKLLYISPERFLTDAPRWSAGMHISFVAIDEAHCISQWGHDFRPAYTGLNHIRAMWPDVPIMALTATADRVTREDIAVQLAMKAPKMFVGSFDRPNISLAIKGDSTQREHLAAISSLINRYPDDSGIVYCLTRKTTEKMAEALIEKGFRAAPYHAELPASVRSQVQEMFKAGDLQAICATVAFGMGIDKSNIRWVVHNNMPGNIESYYQEIGRGGRDGLPAHAIMYYSGKDILTHRYFIEESGQPEVKEEKLQRIIDLTQSKVCRRRVLLSYFNETLDHDCGNCDVCRNPPKTFDARIPVQMALSAIIRTRQTVGPSMLVDLLRGSLRAEIARSGFNRIKTFGVGRDISASRWRHIISQMVLMGIAEQSIDRHGILSVTPYGMMLLRTTEPVPMPEMDMELLDGRTTRKRKTHAAPKPVKSPEELLLDDLKAVRRKIADKIGVPPYMVFNDMTIEQMAAAKPVSLGAFAAVEGVSDINAVRYWPDLGKVLARHRDPGTHFEPYKSPNATLFLLERDYAPADIARIRGLKPATIYSHMVELFEAGELVDCQRWVTPAQLQVVRAELAHGVKGLKERLAGRLPEGIEPFALAVIRAQDSISL